MANFDPTEFKEIFPGFESVTQAQFNYAWADVSYYSGKFISNYPADQQNNANYLILAHVLTLRLNNAVGRVASAGDGSVSTSLAYSDTDAGAWWNQTSYGAEIWSRYFVARGGFRYFPSCSAIRRLFYGY